MMQKLHINYATVPQNYGAFQVYACITHNYTTFTQIVYAAITHTLRRNYANKLRTLRKYYAEVTQRIYAIITQFYAKNYALFTQSFYAIYAKITQICLRRHYANFPCLRNYITQILRRYYANKLRIHYAYYADFTQINYATLRKITQRLRK